VNINNMVVFGQQLKAFGSYISNANDFLTLDPTDGATTIKLYADVLIPAGTGVKFYVSNGEDVVSNPIWEVIDPLNFPVASGLPDNPTPGSITVSGDGIPAKGGFTSRAFAHAFDNTITKNEKNRTRLRVDMFQTLDGSGNPLSPFLTPRVRNLASVINPIVFVS
jgi:hypothetical protein